MRQSVHQQIDEAALTEALRRSPEKVAITYSFIPRGTSATVDLETGAMTSSPTTVNFDAIRSVTQVETVAQVGGGQSIASITIWCFAVDGQAFSTRDHFVTDDDSKRWSVVTADISPGMKSWILIAEREG